MHVDHIELQETADPTPLQNWLDDHPNAVIERVLVSGSHFYIWYTS